MYIRVLDCILTTSFPYILYCGCFNLFCNVCVCVCFLCMCVCAGFVMCGCFCNMSTCIYCVSIFCTVFFVLLRLFVFVCTTTRNTATERQLNCSLLLLFQPPARNYFCCHFLFSHFQLLEMMILVSSEQRIRVGKSCAHKSSQFVSTVEERQNNINYAVSRP